MFARFLGSLARQNVAVEFVFLLAILVRLLVGLSSYSGAGNPPTFGDYEAQRHWMEITLHTPVREWYSETPQNNLTYWGLDYPPLTAYQSYLHGLFVSAFEPEAVGLESSRGYETPSSKLLMRWTVLLSDVLVFFPAAWWFVRAYYGGRSGTEQAWALSILLLQPASLLVDHGHFQYNCISLGFALAAAAAIIQEYEVVGSVLFCLSLNHKQMSMYLAPAFFAHLLGRSFQKRRPLLHVIKLGVIVIATFAVLWAPYLSSAEAVLQVFSRLAPLKRGLWEDHVANFWCTTSMLPVRAFKWKKRLSVEAAARLAGATTVTACLPFMWNEIRRPSKQGLIRGMLISGLAFFLFSFQVHEKSILLPLLPATMLALDSPWVVQWLAPIAAFSMFPLLVRDGQALTYVASQVLYLLIANPPPSGLGDSCVWFRLAFPASLIGVVVIHLGALFLEPPAQYPYLKAAAMTSYGFVHFVLLVLYLNKKVFTSRTQLERTLEKKES
ncbi:alpha-1,3-glucosyltransferase [Klebsormidium nitens]|uniref:Alpha-1,3-glucosyltransferase n=1 Tax=Klebsormidium nitens TaxID=105231 RepID=A0A1Y1IE40_KLENI|nr:alpha-1,3-glucosyltransferase [Klebsormidium nitens]|eukprot:GAQ86987.1 alpha-1,3-glucosyltransferase [Klebsormidium nitens]